MLHPKMTPAFYLFVFTVLRAIIDVIPNMIKMVMFSKVLAAITLFGIPFLLPYPSLINYIIIGTTTAGATAEIHMA